MARQLAIYGGSFDPVHNGHLRVIRAVMRETDADTLYLVPCRKPVHKSDVAASATHRWAMLEQAIKHLDNVMLSDTELRSDHPGYTLDTLNRFEADFPGTALYFCLGQDSVDNFPSWHGWREILKKATLIAYPRQLAGGCRTDLKWWHDLSESDYRGEMPIYWLNQPAYHCSSRDLRRQIKQVWHNHKQARLSSDRPIDVESVRTQYPGLASHLPTTVLDYIFSQQLYQ